MNKVILMGNLARDPELRTTNGGISVCSFTIACNRTYTNAQGVREADFINCVAWREKADLVSRYFTKGRKILVEGSMQTRSYEAQDGSKRYATEVVVDTIEFVEPKGEGGGSSGGYAPPPQGGGQRAPHNAAPAPDDDFVQVDDDELPF